jgi:cation transport regulator
MHPSGRHRVPHSPCCTALLLHRFSEEQATQETFGMPYRGIDDLPQQIRAHLPPPAQEIYLRAFNNAWQQYASPLRRRPGSSQEQTAHRVAWAAVKRQYLKIGDQWTPRC